MVALIWAAVGMSFFGGVTELNDMLTQQKGNTAWIVNLISNSLLGRIGAVIAILGVVAAPISTGDTAFRSARLIISDFLNLEQKSLKNRLILTVPLFVAGFLLTLIDFSIIWRYMAWSNQTLAVIVLWAITVYLAVERKPYWITLIPTIFMTAVVTAYILVAPEGLGIKVLYGQIIGIAFSLVMMGGFFIWLLRIRTLQGKWRPVEETIE
jgi:carbon starvation protein CstA